MGFGMGILAGSLLVGAFLLVGWLAWRVVGMYMMREIDGLELAVLLSVIVGLMFAALAGGGGLGLIALVLLWVVGMSYPVINRLSLSRRLNAMVEGDIRGYEEGLKRQPDVPFPHRRLGDIYFERGDWDKAVEHYQGYLEIHAINAHCSNRLERALMQKRREDLGLRMCAACGEENSGDAARCEACGAYLKGAQEIIDVLTTPGMMRVWRWVIVAFLLPALVLGAIPGTFGLVTGLMLVISVTATVFYLYARMTDPERGQ